MSRLTYKAGRVDIFLHEELIFLISRINQLAYKVCIYNDIFFYSNYFSLCPDQINITLPVDDSIFASLMIKIKHNVGYGKAQIKVVNSLISRGDWTSAGPSRKKAIIIIFF